MRAADVLIIGGGPAGSSCAWHLRRSGFDVVVWDRKPFPRDKVCAGWITPHVVAALELDLGDYASGARTCQPISGFQVSRQGDREARVRYERPVSYGIRRCEFDHYLLARTAAEQRLGEPLRTLERRGDQWVVNGAVRAPVLVGAGGHFCPVAQRLGARLGHGEPVIAAQETEFRLTPEQARSCAVEPDLPEIFFTRDLRGYGWVFRKGDFINIGLGRKGNDKLASHVSEFLHWLTSRAKIPPELGAKLCGHPYLLYDQAPRPLVGEGAVLIGDAAGLAYTRSGEGIRPAVESGLLAATAIIEAQGQYDAAHLEPYAQRIVERFGPRTAEPSVLDLLPEWMLGALAGQLFGSGWFARRVVLDDWFFHLQQPPLSVHRAAVELRAAAREPGS